jgi:hypothetical protein
MKYTMVIVLALVALVSPSAAMADKPLREVFPPPSDVTLEHCGFPVLIHIEGKIVSRTWFDDEGNAVRVIETYPGYKWVLTNLLTQERIVVPVPGRAFVEFRADGSVKVTGTGRWTWGLTHPELITGEPGIFFIRGHFTFVVDPEGNFTSFELLGGKIESLCAALA